MIENEDQYKITLNHVDKFTDALNCLNVQESYKELNPSLWQLEYNSVASQLETLLSEVKEYEEKQGLLLSEVRLIKTKAELRAAERRMTELSEKGQGSEGLDPEYWRLNSLIEEYQSLLKLEVDQQCTLIVYDLKDLPELLIKFRIAKGLTQKDLAMLLDMREQQIQRYEKSYYASASLTTLITVSEALGISFDIFSNINKK